MTMKRKFIRKIADLKRPIVTSFYKENEATTLVWYNRAKYSISAVQRAILYMTLNTYGACLAIIHDDNYGMDHAIIKRDVNGKITIEYQRDATRSTFAGTPSDPDGKKALVKKSKIKE